MTDDEAFIATILKHPEDITVRLVYSDYLEERGERLRARFIRAEGEERWPAFCAVCHSLRDELGRLTGLLGGTFGQQGDGPRTPYVEYGGSGQVTFTFRHGFVDVVRCSADAWRQFADALLSAHPVRTVVLTDGPVECEVLATEWPGLTFEPSYPHRGAAASARRAEPGAAPDRC